MKLSFGKYLHSLREGKGMTLREVEKASKKTVSNAYLSQLETDKINNPSPNILHALSEVYDTRYDEMMRAADYPFPIQWTGKIAHDLTIREIQTQLPWTVHYHRDFRNSPMAHKDFGHALLHVQKAAGKLAAVVNDAEHGGSEFQPEEVDRFIADLVVCALRMANTCPGRTIDLQRAVENRIEGKNKAELRREAQ